MKIQTKYRSNFHKMVNFHEVKCTPPTLPPLPRPSKKRKENLHTCPHVHTHKHTHTRTHTNTDYPNTDHQHGRSQFPCYWLRLGLLWCFEG